LQDLKIEYDIADYVQPNPSLVIAEQVLEQCHKYRPDSIIAIGGGSVIDTCKVVAAAYFSGMKIIDIFMGSQPRGKIPLIAVNLTHGSGSEADRYAVITDENTKIKKGLASDVFYPTYSIDDPTLTVTLPRSQTAYTSIDAFYHCLESSSSIVSSPFTRTLAVEAMEKILEYLPRAFIDGSDLEARYWLLYASLLGGVCIDNSRTHIVHAVEHAISGLRPEVAHGLGLVIVGPKLIGYIYSKVPEKFLILREFIPDLKLRSDEHRRVEFFLKYIAEQYNIEPRLSSIGLGKDDIREIVRLTFEGSSHLLALCPYSISNEELERILLEIV
ncbi:MAG: iron-containing alcohol dehydrogenase, partial [Crenarchaeota archaeon]|nr:iron-containing alcohol dehydrogenase [Thermoproteota archaeon]